MKRSKEIERMRKAKEKMDRRHGKVSNEEPSTSPPESDEALQPQEVKYEGEALVHDKELS